MTASVLRASYLLSFFVGVMTKKTLRQNLKDNEVSFGVYRELLPSMTRCLSEI